MCVCDGGVHKCNCGGTIGPFVCVCLVVLVCSVRCVCGYGVMWCVFGCVVGDGDGGVIFFISIN